MSVHGGMFSHRCSSGLNCVDDKRREVMLSKLFNPESWIVLGKTKYDTVSQQVKTLSADKSGYQFFTLNELEEGKSRADKHVKVFRNFLVEFDGISLEEQEKVISESGLPYCTMTFSGSKSYHCVISLQDPCKSEEEYRDLVNWIYAAMPQADPACKNPSRFSRIEGGINVSTGTKQGGLLCRERITQKELIAWLQSRCDKPVPQKDADLELLSDDFLKIQAKGIRGKLHGATERFIKTGGRKGTRHRNLFVSACNLRDNFYTLEEAKILLMTRLSVIYSKEGRSGEDYDLKVRCIEDAFACEPRINWESLEKGVTI